MASEKTPALFLSQTPFEYDNNKEKLCSKSTLSWILAAMFLGLLVLLAFLLFCPPFDQRIRIYGDQPIEVRVISPTFDPEDDRSTNALKQWDFEFLIDPVDLCSTLNPPDSGEYENDPEVKLLILVSSTVDHFEQRKAIRKTWGSVAEKPYGPMRLSFILGTTSNSTVQELNAQESSEFRDIIQVDVPEGKRQQTAKSVLMLKWVAQRCPHAQYFLKADDDTFVNVASIAAILSREPYISEERFIGGYVHNEVQSVRLPETDIYIALDEYPQLENPPYASGSAYIMTIPTAIELFDAAQVLNPLPPQEDDVFLTGQCAQYAGVPLIHEPSFLIDDPPIPPSWNSYSTLATAHSVTPDILQQIWDDMNQSISNSMHFMEFAINSTSRLRKKRNILADNSQEK